MKETMLNHLDLFSGIGGFTLAAQLAGGINTIAFSEIDPFCSRLLRKRWPDIPNLGDIRKINYGLLQKKEINKIDIITGGFPCQPWSQASRNPKGTADNRHLWPEMLRVISETRPAWVCGENVYGLIGSHLDTVVHNLEDEGYEVWPAVVPACSVGAPHRRYRIWIVAHANGESQQRIGGVQHGKWPTLWDNIDGCHETVGNSDGSGPQGCGELGERTGEWTLSSPSATLGDSSGVEEPESNVQTDSSSVEGARGIPISSGGTNNYRDIESRLGGAIDGISSWLDKLKWPAGKGLQQYAWEFRRVAPTKEIPDRADRLSALGNAVVPQLAAIFLKGIVESEQYHHE